MVTPAAPAAAPTLARVLGTRQLAANIVNTVVGSGIFVLPAAVAALLGPAAVVAYAICAVAVGLVALCFAECGSRVTASGGPYAYVEAAFGPYLGALAGALAYLGTVAGAAAVATVLAASLGQFWPVLAEPGPRAAFVVALFGALAAVNVRGIRSGVRVVEFMTVAKLGPLVLLALVGLVHLEPVHLAWPAMPAWREVGAATLLLIFAFMGTESALTPSGEVRDPHRTVPRALLLGLLTITALYGALQLVAQGVLGPALALETVAPLAATAGGVMGDAGRTLLLVGATISTAGYVTSDALGSPRILFGLARDGLLPRPLGAVHARFRTPWLAILAHAAIACALALAGTFALLALVSVVSALLLYLGCAGAALALRRSDLRADGEPFVAPGGPLVPVAAALVTLWLLAQASAPEYAAVAVVLLLASGLYLLRRRRVRALAAQLRVPGDRAARATRPSS